MTADTRLPFLRGGLSAPETFQNPKYGGPKPMAPPARDPQAHAADLRAQLDAIARVIAARPEGTRVEGATREIVAVEPEPGYALAAKSLGDQRADVRVIFQDPETGVVLLDAKDAALPHLHAKVERYADDDKMRGEHRAGEKAIAPIRQVREAGRADRAGPRFRAAPPSDGGAHWFELTCRGGVHATEDTTASRAQVHAVLVQRMGLQAPQEFVATETVIFYARLTIAQIDQLIYASDALLAFDLVEPAICDWLRLEDPPVVALRDFNLIAPPAAAPSVVVLDSGIATTHPMLAPALLSAEVTTAGGFPEDRYGHGTQMAGVALYQDVGAAVDDNQAAATHWIQSVKILDQPLQGAAAEDQRPFWPAVTVKGVELAEAGAVRDRAFIMAVSATLDDAPAPTTWSHAVDQLAYNGGQGRLFAVAIGNAPVDQLAHLQGYPATSLVAKLHDPSQAVNALTVGAFTAKTILPPAMLDGAWALLAPLGGISPHSSGGVLDRAIKPEIVLEGGNVAFDGRVGDPTVDSLVDLTTHHRHAFGRPLATIFATSGATAHAGRLAAEVWAANPGLWPETVRGLLVHSASWTTAMLQQFPDLPDRLAACGYGVPNAELARSCATDCATVIIEDVIANRVEEHRPKKVPLKRPGTPTTEVHEVKVVRFFRLPVPMELLLDDPHRRVGLRVTLSYFAEPNTFRRRQDRGMDLRWDMQGPGEGEDEFRTRINKLARGEGPGPGTKSFDWAVGFQRRSRGTVQSDRWFGAAPDLAGDKLIAVYPVGGWWDDRQAMRLALMRFSLLVTIQADGLPVYAPLAAALGAGHPTVVLDV